MEISEISEWLRTTITGIVLLGALGSILSVAALKFLGPPIQKLALKPLRYIGKERLWRYWRSGTAYAHIRSDSTNRKLIYYLFRHLARLIIALTSFGVATTIFSITVTSNSDVLLTYGTFILSMVGFLSAYWAWTEYDYITINYTAEWQGTGLVKEIPNAKVTKRSSVADPSNA